MAAAKKKKEEKNLKNIVTPVGVAVFPHIDKPDTEGKYADNKRKTTVAWPKEGAENQADIDEFVALVREAHKDVRGNLSKCPIKDGDETGKDYFEGKWKMTFKSQYKVAAVDTKRKELPDDVQIRGGDLIRVACTIAPYGDSEGVTGYLNAVQLVEKRAAGMGASAFDEIDGFETKSDDNDSFADDDDF